MKIAARKKKYNASPKGRAAQNRYNATPKAVAGRKKYEGSLKGKASRERKILSVRKSHGFDEATIAKLLVFQNGCCAICLRKLDKSFHCDHDHTTKIPRGILCRTCNNGLGYFKDDPALFDAAKNYLNNPPVGLL